MDVRKADLFERARRRWLEVLRKAGGWVPDGRPLFWSGERAGTRTYFTFYPFASWADLDARVATITKTHEALGKAAVEDYDSGDAALVAPHHSEVWSRLTEVDVASPGAEELTELSAREGVLEFRRMPVGSSDDFDAVWGRVKKAVAARKLPLACRGYSSSYGRGELIIFWLAHDAAALDGSPARESPKSPEERAAARALDAAAPLRERLRVRRREDLSNLPR